MGDAVRRLPILQDGIMPFLWLIYLVPSVTLWGPVPRPAGRASVRRALVAFLCYAAGYGSRGTRAIVFASIMFLFGAVARRPIRVAATYFIYGRRCRVGLPGGPAYRLIAAYTALVALASGCCTLPYGGVPAVIFSAIIGVACIAGAEQQRSNARLRQANAEIEGLAKIAERERIARDLHDVLGHTLSLITLKSQLASKLADRDPARAVAEIRAVEQIARTSLDELRAAVAGYRARGDPRRARARARRARVGRPARRVRRGPGAARAGARERARSRDPRVGHERRAPREGERGPVAARIGGRRVPVRDRG